MAEAYRDHTRKRVKMSRDREHIDALTGVLNFIPGGTIPDDIIDYITNAYALAYNLYNSPYWRERNWKMFGVEAGVYGLASLVELIPFLNDILPGHYLASKALDQVYAAT